MFKLLVNGDVRFVWYIPLCSMLKWSLYILARLATSVECWLMRLCEREHADCSLLSDGSWFQIFKSCANTVLCTGTLNGVVSIQTDERWWRISPAEGRGQMIAI